MPARGMKYNSKQRNAQAMQSFTQWFLIGSLILMLGFRIAFGQKDYNGAPMFMNVNKINLELKKLNGEGQFTSQYSWMLTGSNPQNTELWYYPQDEWHSQMLYQIYNPICPDDNGMINEDTVNFVIPPEDNRAFRVPGKNVYSWERRRYRPPYVTVDDVPLYQEYRWETYPDLKADMVATWEDVLRNHGMRVRIDAYAYSNANHDDYIIWKATYKFTGETKIPLEDPGPEDYFPDQTVRLWWPLSFSFGPSKAGEYAVTSSFAFEGQDDLESWFARPSKLVTNRDRDSLKVAYYWDYKFEGATAYPNGSSDDTGDPDRFTGHLLSPQIPGFALLHSAKNSFAKPSDDPEQPFAIPQGTIEGDFWGRRDLGRRDRYTGQDGRGRFPLDPISEGWNIRKGPMRFITIGPYELSKNAVAGTFDSLCAVYAVGVGSISWEEADSIGRAWFEGEISNQEKNEYIMHGRDSLFQALDRAYWTWNRDFNIPDPPPPPDVEVMSDADRIQVRWSYPDENYFKDPDTGVEDWAAWRVYRKKGAAYVNDPLDQGSGERWELVYETAEKEETQYTDHNVTRGVSYYYAVTAVDDGSQNTTGLFPGQALESSRYVNRTGLPAIPFKAGLSEADRVRVVPNPATIRAGSLGFPGEEDRIVFANLPYKCKLSVFTETGDHIVTIDHFGTDQEIWDQRNDANQYVTSGLYILAITEAEAVDGKGIPDQFVKFVLVR